MASRKETDSFTWDDLKYRPPHEKFLFFREYYSAYLANLESGYHKEAEWCLRVAENIALKSGMSRTEQRLAEQEIISTRAYIKRLLDEPLDELVGEDTEETPPKVLH